MKSSEKRQVGAYITLLFAAALSIKAGYAGECIFLQEEETADTNAEKVVLDGEDAIEFWYYGEENKAFFERCADDFQKETGIAVRVTRQQSLDYFSGIYDAVKEGINMPDVYLLSSEELERAYYCQLVDENQTELKETNFAKKAIEAVNIEGNYYGYPLYFNTCVFVYRTDYFETAPASVQEIIDYATEHEPSEGVEKLFEWDLSDGFYNYAFLGSGITFPETEDGCVTPTYQEEIWNNSKTFFGNLTAVIALNEEELNSQKVADDFAAGKTVAVLLQTDHLKEIGESSKVTTLPKLNEELEMSAIAETSVLCVNDMSESKTAADYFANYVVSAEQEKHLWEETGHMPTNLHAVSGEIEQTAMKQYESAKLTPDALNATDFWVKFQNEALAVWNTYSDE